MRIHAASGSLVTMLVVQAVIVITGLMQAWGAGMSAEQIAALTAAAGFVGIVATIVLWARTVPREQVLEHLIGDAAVVAGEANDLVPTGELVRAISREEV